MRFQACFFVALVSLWTVFSGKPLTAQTWSQLATSGTPPTTAAPDGGGYDATNNRLIVFLPFTSGGQVWVLTNANGLGGAATWIQLVPTGTAPINNTESSVVYDASTNQLIVYGGCSANCGSPLAEVSVLSNANGLGGTPAWTQSTTNPPEGRDGQSAVYNSTNKTMIAFGGGLAFFGTDQNDTRTLTPANAPNSSWNTLSPMGTLPGVRELHTAVYDQKHNIMTIFGGNNAASCCPVQLAQYNDVWVLTDADGTGTNGPAWTELAPTGTPPAARSESQAVYDSGKNTMYIFGGLQLSSDSQTATAFGDLWKLSNANGRGTATPKWTQIGQFGTPPGGNYAQVVALDEINQRIIIFGGADRNETVHNLTFILDLLQD
jgi:hypothetical protein